MAVTIEAKRLLEMCYNVRTYTPSKGSLEPFTYWTTKDLSITATASDNYVAITDSANCETVAPEYREFFVGLPGLKQWEELLKPLDGTVSISWDDESVLMTGSPLEPPVSIPLVFSEELRTWRLIVSAIHETLYSGDHERISKPFALHPDRLRKLSLLKPGTYPICIQIGESEVVENVAAQFQIGSVRGIIQPMDYDDLQELYKEETWVLL